MKGLRAQTFSSSDKRSTGRTNNICHNWRVKQLVIDHWPWHGWRFYWKPADHLRLQSFTKRNTEHGSGLGRWRWVVERTFAWLNQFRRLRVRYEKQADIHEAFLSLGCALICWRFLRVDWVRVES